MWDEPKVNWNMIFMGILIVGIVIMGIAMAMGHEETRTISVDGSKTVSVKPDESIIQLSVENTENTAKDASAENAKTMSNVMTALKKEGVASYEIKTISVNVYPEYDYDTSPMKITGYKAVHTIEITTDKTESIGAYLDAAVSAGANRVDNVKFTLSEGYQNQLRSQALEGAAKDAKMKAEAIARGISLSVGKAVHVQATTSYVPFFAVEAADVRKGQVPTQVQSGEIEFTVDVNIDFKIN